MSTPIITHIKIDKPRKWSGEKKSEVPKSYNQSSAFIDTYENKQAQCTQ